MAQPAPNFTKDAIKSRLARKAAELWGYADTTDIDNFDPLVALLLEACAVEFEKIGQEIGNTQHRLVERLAGQLNPDVVDAPRPAHAVAQAHPREPHLLLPAEAQFVYQRATAGRGVATPAVFFSPLQPVRLVDGAVRYLATDSAIWQTDGIQKQVLALASQAMPAEHRRLWLGLELGAGVESLADLTFYFDWPNEPHRAAYYPFLPGETWLTGEHPLRVTRGMETPSPPADAPVHQEYELLPRLEQHVRELYEPGFARVLPSAATQVASLLPQLYPAEFAERFTPTELQALQTPLIWLEVRFSHALPPEALTNIVCALNCFPVLNRRLNKRLFRLRQALNIFPLDSEEAFLAIREVYSLSNVLFRPTTLRGLQEGETDTYALRAHGVGRFDTRTGREALQELLELLRDESRAFTATGTDFVSATLRELNQSLARLEERLGKESDAVSPMPYVMLRPRDTADSVYLEYWSSDGEGGNKLPAGSRLQVYDGHFIDNVRLLATTTGGRERPRPEERLFALRKNLLSRNRVVTLEDIKAVCWAELGTRLAQVQVEKAFKNGDTPEAGFVRCLRVTLTPATPNRLTPQEWQRAAEDLQVLLAGQSAMNLPYEVRVASVFG